MSLFPIFLKLDSRLCVVVGGGTIAAGKIGSLLVAGAMVLVVAPEAVAEIKQWEQEGKLRWRRGEFVADDVAGAFLVVAATGTPEVNQAVYRECVARGILCNAVDDPPHCDFYFPSVVRRGDLQIAISTAGQSPAFAQRLRREIDGQLPEDLGEWLADAGRTRRLVLATYPPGEDRRQLLHALVAGQAYAHRDSDKPSQTGRVREGAAQ